ncbi:MAG: glycosyltransferase [Deltaproteobacteria bacterium]|nr:glycosyltransferase [Deltaproteobacteria bacterium]MBW1873988.1 glycosyltransferase [Deltaproteobacteria bacterium]MBW2210140.1 glycosyltransferase [Deltaproteobacteria bacterium]MBW2213347.1 glycosyltransferase [Deltaproteobacteria bacterium]MBW2378292.1 glycosyltransferase [Deltaproteobacteria bacterium]
MSEPFISIVIPVYNEEAILRAAVVDLIDRLCALSWSYELLIAENGSTDGTSEVAAELAKRFDQLVYRHTDEPNYGKALRDGILHARGELVICDEIDLCDTDFHERAVALLQDPSVDFVIGSKVMEGAKDERPFYRRLGTVVINGMLRVTLGFKGTDTHGLKAFRREPVQPIARACVVDRDLFASELVIRAERAGLGVQEIPVRVLEKRPPTVGLARRVPNVLKNLAKLFIAIRIKR